jgi:glucose-1-phosphate cytidylyltransferase
MPEYGSMQLLFPLRGTPLAESSQCHLAFVLSGILNAQLYFELVTTKHRLNRFLTPGVQSTTTVLSIENLEGRLRVVILAGGRGSRLSEETNLKPKPMVEIGGRPILWHIMKHYEAHGFDDFVVALGYRGNDIKEWVINQSTLSGDLTVDFRNHDVVRHEGNSINWSVSLADTGASTMTGGRLRRLAPYLGQSTFMMTYGDGVSSVDITKLLAFHRAHGRLATVTAVRPPARFGHLELLGDRVDDFSEKPQAGEGWINGGFYVLEPAVLDYIDGDDTIFERGPLTRLASDGELMAFRWEGFWQCMDTMREKDLLEELWLKEAPWKTWR